MEGSARLPSFRLEQESRPREPRPPRGLVLQATFKTRKPPLALKDKVEAKPKPPLSRRGKSQKLAKATVAFAEKLLKDTDPRKILQTSKQS